MGTIRGKITNKSGEPIEKAIVALKNKEFEDLHVTYTDEDGNYKLHAENKEYPYLFIVKNFAVDNLEFWCKDINLKGDIEINASIDKLEIYGLKVFKIDGGYPALMIYFRPMSLVKHLNGDSDIFPNLDKIEVKINNEKSEIYVVNQVEEFVGSTGTMKACLVQISIPEKGLKEIDNYLSVQITDKDGCLGQASTYF
ncbi:MAG: carboxypeptidase-like regulatory domain-containing protein [Paraclostridium sp.]